jgi:hypothetical protein
MASSRPQKASTAASGADKTGAIAAVAFAQRNGTLRFMRFSTA